MPAFQASGKIFGVPPPGPALVGLASAQAVTSRAFSPGRRRAGLWIVGELSPNNIGNPLLRLEEVFYEMGGMTDYLNCRIEEIKDEEVQKLFDEICLFLALKPLIAKLDYGTLGALIASVGNQSKLVKLSITAVSEDGQLARRVCDLKQVSALYDLCVEIARLTQEWDANPTVLSLIKQLAKLYGKKPKKVREPTKRERNLEFKKELILRNRKSNQL